MTDEHVIREGRTGRQSQYAVELIRRSYAACLQIPVPTAHPRDLLCLRELLLAYSELRLRDLSFSDVGDQSENAFEATRPCEDRARRHERPAVDMVLSKETTLTALSHLFTVRLEMLCRK